MARAAALAAALALGALVLWRILGPERPSRRATALFSAGLLVTLPALAVAVLLVISAG